MQAGGADLVEGGAQVLADGLEHVRVLLVRRRAAGGGRPLRKVGPGPAEGGGCAGPGRREMVCGTVRRYAVQSRMILPLRAVEASSKAASKSRCE
ncbi:hypothetical protein Sxan_10940 [Streptomyces xanthophaeus]|uniref:Uncharacterized protein n=1 Tax=Streptomyces xanthophaeus TaxID=67385 RepID=A0A919GTB7_9ACTN|nr:hypothetical protein Sxan_10940 [Streptomyces xanthophaeus]